MLKAQIVAAQEMRDDGLTYREIGEALDVSLGAVHYNLNPATRERQALRIETQRQAICDAKAAVAIENGRCPRTAYGTSTEESKRARKARYRRDHRDEINVYKAGRRAFLAGCLVGANAAQKAEIAEIYRMAREDSPIRCYLCGELIPIGQRHVDHIFPVAEGGLTRPSNLAVACKTCNLSKGSKMPEDIGMLI